MEDMRRVLSHRENTVIFSLFNEEDLLEEDSMEGYSISAWGQYQASADALRGYVHQQHVFGLFEYRYNPLHWMDGKDPLQLGHVASVCYYALPIRICVV
jgi:hypothetical protein